MNTAQAVDANDDVPILSIIQKIKDGIISPKTIGKETRCSCVEVMVSEGYSVPQIAQMLGLSEKTIRRDIELIRERNIAHFDPDFADKMAGEIIWYSRLHRGQLMRLSRAKDGSVGERVQAEYLASRVQLETVRALQLLGYLPTQPNTLTGELCQQQDTRKQIAEQITADLKATEALLEPAERAAFLPVKQQGLSIIENLTSEAANDTGSNTSSES